jgi:manganese/zinc/iron transport system substrate-binding protein
MFSIAIIYFMREKVMPFKYLACVLAISGLIFAGCGQKEEDKDTDISRRSINVVSTTGMITDIIKNVGGERVTAIGLMGPGVDPHLYKASAGDVNRMQKADIIFYNGLHLEGAMAELFEKMESRKTTVAVTGGVPEDRLLSPPEFEGAHDPHVWFDVSLWMEAVRVVRDALAKLDSINTGIYEANSRAYLDKLQDLHEYVKSRASDVPQEQRVLVTAHDAFNYFGRAYGFVVRGLQGISTATEAGTADVQELSSFIVQRRIPAIFIESSVPRRTIEAVQAAVKSKGFDVKIGGELYSDAMGNPDTPEGTYIGMVRYNIDTIVTALLDE